MGIKRLWKRWQQRTGWPLGAPGSLVLVLLILVAVFMALYGASLAVTGRAL